MTISPTLLLVGFFTLGAILIILAGVHVVQGTRFADGSKLIHISTAIFLTALVSIIFCSWLLLRPVNWGGSFTIFASTSTESSSELPQ